MASTWRVRREGWNKDTGKREMQPVGETVFLESSMVTADGLDESEALQLVEKLNKETGRKHDIEEVQDAPAPASV